MLELAVVLWEKQENCWRSLWNMFRNDRALWEKVGLQFCRFVSALGVAGFSPGTRVFGLRSAHSAAVSHLVRTEHGFWIECSVKQLNKQLFTESCKPLKWVSIPLFYKWSHWSSERLSKLSNDNQSSHLSLSSVLKFNCEVKSMNGSRTAQVPTLFILDVALRCWSR